MGKKGLSAEEKRKRMMEFFYETEDVWQLKEVEKRCSKDKGITSMAIKDVLQSLVDDNLVHAEKIGTSNYYWAFPSEGASVRNTKLKELQQKIQELRDREVATQSSISAASKGREPSAKRSKVLEELGAARARLAAAESELQVYRDCDPEVLQAREKQTEVCRTAVERWTDNILNIRSFCQKTFGLDPQTFDKSFGVPADLE